LRMAWSSIPMARLPRPSASKITTAEFVSRLAEHSRVSRVNQDGKRDNQDGKFFKGVVFEHFGSDLAL
jgi:hypothetical protein